VQENCFRAIEHGADADTTRRLNGLYYKVRSGLGFNKSPAEYGAYPTDPYSHTPGHGGARQPGMTGQVKEEVLSRFGELGIRVRDGQVGFEPVLLRPREFRTEPGTLCFVDVDGNWQEIEVPARALAFTWCQVPVVYRLDDTAPSLTLEREDGRQEPVPELALDAEASASLFSRDGRIRRLDVSFTSNLLFNE